MGRAAVVEPLEDRRLLSVSTATGWTVVTPSAGARRVYVSSTRGNDKNAGTTPSAPLKSLAAAAALVRDGTDDQLLLARGDTWTTGFGSWAKSGASATNPMLIGTYGTGARPAILTGTGSGLVANTGRAVNHLVIEGIAFEASSRNPARGTVTAAAAAATPTGLQLLGPSTDVTVDDCAFADFKDDVVIEGAMGAVGHITVRRSSIDNAYCTSAHASGLYADQVTGLTLDADTFDHDGWNATVNGAGQTAYNHAVYTSSTTAGLTVTGCTIAHASFAAVMARGGGVIDDNLILDNAAGVVFGNANGALSTAGGVRGEIRGNVILGDHGVGTTAYGEGIEIGNTAKGADVTVSGNVIAGDTQGTAAAITLSYANATTNPAAAVGLNDLTVSNNTVYGWLHGISLAPFADGGTGVASLNNLTVTGNTFAVTKLGVWHQGAYQASAEHWSANTYVSAASAATPFKVNGTYQSLAAWQSTVERSAAVTPPAFAAPTRTAGTYAASVGLSATPDALVTAADAQSSAHWSSAYTAATAVAYVEAGFAVGPAYAVLAATVSGTAGSYRNNGETVARAADGDLSTYFNAPAANGAVVVLDLGSAHAVRQIKFAPRASYAARMVGGTFQVSNDATFKTGVTTLYTVSAAPASGVLTTVTLSSAVTARYVRYVAPAGSYGNVAEVQAWG